MKEVAGKQFDVSKSIEAQRKLCEEKGHPVSYTHLTLPTT